VLWTGASCTQVDTASIVGPHIPSRSDRAARRAQASERAWREPARTRCLDRTDVRLHTRRADSGRASRRRNRPASQRPLPPGPL